MSELKRVLAIDIGASSGRAILGEFDGKKIQLKEVHRFLNEPVNVLGTTYWDVLRLFHEIKQGIIKAKIHGGFDFIGIDTWGVDFGLLDKRGKLLENPVHYRDLRTKGMIEKAFEKLSANEFYENTGIQFMELNTVFQLLSLKENRRELLERADTLLFMPELLGYMLTGEKGCEYSIATTSQLVDINTKTWSDKVLDALELPKRILPEIKQPGTMLGMLTPEICEECGIESKPVISVCGHDTQSAITAVPCPSGDFAFLSSGTWSLFGTETDNPIINEMTFKTNITNEGGYGESVGFLKNIIGLWLIQESRRHWGRQGEEYSYAQLEKLALAAEPMRCFIDPDSPEFVSMGDIPSRVREFCKRTGQYVPSSVGEVMRCIYESLAMKYKYTFENLQACTGKKFPVIHVIGGGTKDTLLCQLTANSCEVPVSAGPVEATVIGNVLVALLSSGAIENISQAREIVLESEEIKTYLPENTQAWQEGYEKFKKIL